ncbi:MAG: polyamine aminopropyltransferase [Proteobacteria bacterium]|nr:polyamine aminopropyltransferase [Pseudomonadota bacterium]
MGSSSVRPTSFNQWVLLAAVFVVGLCTVVYELLIGSVSSYLLGDSVRVFSLTVGLTMSAMGFGTYLSRLVRRGLLSWFVGIEIALGLLGGLSVPALAALFALSETYYPGMITAICLLGTLIGVEIPLLTRLMSQHYELRTNISNVLSLDYLGALVATLLFPFVLLPFLGIFAASLVTGLLNLCVAGLLLYALKNALQPRARRRLLGGLWLCTGVLVTAQALAQPLLHSWESRLFEDRVVLSRQTRYQKIVITKNRRDVRMFLQGHLQFSSLDEHRYHEALVHVAMAAASRPERVLILGGGDGMAVRELLKYPEQPSITLVDLDPEVTALARTMPLLRQLNRGSLDDRRVEIRHADAFDYLRRQDALFDVIIADLPDPNSSALARLYSRGFFQLVRTHLSRSGVFVTQATSPFFARHAFWCIERTVRAAGYSAVVPYHAYVPSMGDWGFVLASGHRIDTASLGLRVPTRFLDAASLASLFAFPKDLQSPEVAISTLDRPAVLRYYLHDWQAWD